MESRQEERTLFIGGLDPRTTREKLQRELCKIAPVRDLNLIMNKNKELNKGYAFFVTVKHSDLNLFNNKIVYIEGRRLYTRFKDSSSGNSFVKKRVFVGGLPAKHLSDSHLEQLFVPFGRVRLAYGIRSVRGDCKGYGYVDFYESIAAIRAVRNSSRIFCQNRQLDVRHFRRSGARALKESEDKASRKTLLKALVKARLINQSRENYRLN